jgi:hypothetical protein
MTRHSNRGPWRLANILGPLDSAEVPGGCDHCDAYQTVKPIEAGIWNITVHHDDDCPVWLRIETRSNSDHRRQLTP